MGGPRLEEPHFESEVVEVRWETLTLADGREYGEVAVAETPSGTVTRLPSNPDSRKRAWLSALGGALAADFDAVDYRDVVLRHDEDNHIDGGTVRAVTPHGCKTVWGDKDAETGVTEAVIWRALEPALAGELEANREVEA